jgi:rod shape-determining protein MreC
MANGTWRMSRGRSGAQLPLAIAAVLAVVLLLAGKAHFLPFDRARASVTDWAAPYLSAMNAPVVAVSHWSSGVGHFFDTYRENLRLREENARLRQWQGAALALQARMKRYELLLNAVPDPSLSAVTARVIGRSSHPFLETMIVNAGRRNGIKPGQAVVDARGMLGRIYLAGDHTSWVVLLTDLNSRIPVTVQPKDVQAILAGDNTATPNLEALAPRVKLKADQEVVTSGDGGLLPPGLPVGVLVAGKQGFRVALFASSLSADDVRILDFKNPIEQLPKPTVHDLPVAAAGFKPVPPPPPQPATPVPALTPAPEVQTQPGATQQVIIEKPDQQATSTGVAPQQGIIIEKPNQQTPGAGAAQSPAGAPSQAKPKPKMIIIEKPRPKRPRLMPPYRYLVPGQGIVVQQRLPPATGMREPAERFPPEPPSAKKPPSDDDQPDD